jgi:hypothetical protein
MTSSPLRRAAWPAFAMFACCGAHGVAHATRPMVVDDAGITGPGQCQLESWTQRTLGQTELWAVPACNVGGKWELAAGLGRTQPDGAGDAFRSGVVQAKTVFRPLERNGWGVGLTIANQFRADQGAIGDLSVLVPVSISLLDDRVLVHLNAGWLHTHASGRHNGFWAAGTEWNVTHAWTLTLETYGTGPGRHFQQAGARLNLIPDRLALDTGIGSRLGNAGADRFVTFGLTLAGNVSR